VNEREEERREERGRVKRLREGVGRRGGQGEER